MESKVQASRAVQMQFHRELKAPAPECPVGYVAQLKSPSKPHTPEERFVSLLREHNSWSEDHPVLQDEAKTVRAYCVLCTSIQIISGYPCCKCVTLTSINGSRKNG